jgi:hypothetical protein
MKPSEHIDKLIAGLNDWQGKIFSDIRKIILEADSEIVEEWKWMGTPVWYKDGMICLADAFKDKVKITFLNGASLQDPDKVFNNGLGGKKWRAIDIHKEDKIREQEFKKLILSAIAYNIIKKSTK